jgi:hypothetical protein
VKREPIVTSINIQRAVIVAIGKCRLT